MNAFTCAQILAGNAPADTPVGARGVIAQHIGHLGVRKLMQRNRNNQDRDIGKDGRKIEI